MLKIDQRLDKEIFGRYCLSKLSIIAFNYFLIELNKTYKPNLTTSIVSLELNHISENLLELIISTNDEKMRNRIGNFEEYIDEIYYLFILFQKNEFKLISGSLDKLFELTYNTEQKQFKLESFNNDSNNSFLEWRLLIEKSKYLQMEIEFISIFLRKLHCFNFHLGFLMTFDRREILNLTNFSLILPNINQISEYFEKRVNISKNFQYFYNSSYLNFNSNLNKEIIYECFVVFHKVSKINFLELTFTIDRKITLETFKILNSLKTDNSFLKLMKNIGVKDVVEEDEIIFDKIQINTVNDHSIGIFINMNSVNNEKYEEHNIFNDIISFLSKIFDRIKSDNQFICPNTSEKKIIGIFKNDITNFSINIINLYEFIFDIKNNSNFVKKFNLFIQSNKINEETAGELLNNYIFKNGFVKKNLKNM